MTPPWAICGWAQTGRNSALLPYILFHLWASANSEQACGVVTHFPTLARGLAWETHHNVVFWLQMSRLSMLLISLSNADWVCIFTSHFNAFYHKRLVSCLMFWTCMLQDWVLTTIVNRPWDMKELVCHHFQFYAIALLHTIGSLMMLVSMQAREKRSSVQECKFLK